jgi:predicted acylesterase/phospholipase RssA
MLESHAMQKTDGQQKTGARPKTVRILSIDGGGIRGLVPAVILDKLERLSGKATAELFDLIAGTSTGGILALGLSRPGPDGRPLYPAEKMAELYEKEGSRIFTSSLWRKIRSVGSLTEERYPATGIETVLRQYFGESRLQDACTDVLVPSYEIERRAPFFFRSAMARERSDYDFPMWQVARATSAAPTYFEPAKVPAGKDHWALIDGGVFANNPAACALVEARVRHPEATDFLLVSLGTGIRMKRFAIEDAQRWGAARWLRPVLDIVLDGGSATVDYQMEQILGANYLRLQVSLQPGEEAIDDVRPRTLRALRLQAEGLCRERVRDLAGLADRLVAIGGGRQERAA